MGEPQPQAEGEGGRAADDDRRQDDPEEATAGHLWGYFSFRTSQRKRLAPSKAASPASWPMPVDSVG